MKKMKRLCRIGSSFSKLEDIDMAKIIADEDRMYEEYKKKRAENPITYKEMQERLKQLLAEAEAEEEDIDMAKIIADEDRMYEEYKKKRAKNPISYKEMQERLKQLLAEAED